MFFGLGFLAFLGGLVFTVVMCFRFFKYRKWGKEVLREKLKPVGLLCAGFFVSSVVLLIAGGVLEEREMAPVVETMDQAQLKDDPELWEKAIRVDPQKALRTAPVEELNKRPELWKEVVENYREEAIEKWESSPAVTQYVGSPEIRKLIADKTKMIFDLVLQDYAEFAPTAEEVENFFLEHLRRTKAIKLVSDFLRDGEKPEIQRWGHSPEVEAWLSSPDVQKALDIQAQEIYAGQIETFRRILRELRENGLLDKDTILEVASYTICESTEGIKDHIVSGLRTEKALVLAELSEAGQQVDEKWLKAIRPLGLRLLYPKDEDEGRRRVVEIHVWELRNKTIARDARDELHRSFER